jgi:hypothetical protein
MRNGLKLYNYLVKRSIQKKPLAYLIDESDERFIYSSCALDDI